MHTVHPMLPAVGYDKSNFMQKPMQMPEPVPPHQFYFQEVHDLVIVHQHLIVIVFIHAIKYLRQCTKVIILTISNTTSVVNWC